MPAVRFSRDKRGYEYIYLVHTPMRRGKPGRTRVLYWYRTPPGIRIGRQPFDPEVQKLIEQQNPGLTFDWPAIINTPFPPPDMTEYWRERRRAEKAARQERRAQETQDAQESVEPEAGSPVEPEPVFDQDPSPALSPEVAQPGEIAVAPGELDAGGAPADDPAAPRKRRRRRGGRRRRGAGDKPGEVAASDTAGGDADADTQSADDAAIDPSEPSDPSSEGE